MGLKYYLLLFAVVIFSNNLPALQPVNPSKVDSLAGEISKLKREHEKEFEESVSEAIQEKLVGVITKWFGIASLILAILGGLGIKISADKVGKYVTDLAQKTAAKTVESEQAERWRTLWLKQQTFILESKLEKIKMNENRAEVLKELDTLFPESLLTGEKRLMGKYMDELIRVNFDLGKNDELARLVQEHENRCPISEESWANVGIANMELYYKSASPEYRDMAIKASDNSLKVLPNYGEPLAVKLLVHIFGYVKTGDPNKKDELKRNCREIIEHLNAGEDTITAKEAYNYIFKKTGTLYRPYIEELLELFPAEMESMKKRYEFSEYVKEGYNSYKTRDYGIALENYLNALEIFQRDSVLDRIEELLLYLVPYGLPKSIDKQSLIKSVNNYKISEERKNSLITLINRT